MAQEQSGGFPQKIIEDKLLTPDRFSAMPSA
jgi:hypothetical protein